jgi:ApaG protein
MVQKITSGVNIIVETFYQPDYSNEANNEFMFAYKITIENHNDFPVQLLRRHWFIYDSNGSIKEVEGEGVVGVLPKINPGEFYQYVSGCNLKTEIGKMQGSYLMVNLNTNAQFSAFIPSFNLVVPFKLN